ncbi:MFS transporter [Microbacterium sp. ET2]|uniref:MFS transporter n=1 Tax=Microbacterium albipurpureum TaxID=3050384 RepID=UPI00259C8A06|nr:MFS transporter [Microbacterium sp. ET2 (Ac-2212)]WJL96938.1 MFS transporter [Microbacterium sp. ET2 (Ac-2212)]
MSHIETAPERSLSPRYVPRTARFRRYVGSYALASLGTTVLWGAVLTVLLPLQVQQIVAGEIFTGADAGVNLQALTDLQAQVTAGSHSPSAEESRLLELLSRYDARRAVDLSLVTSVGVFVTMLIQPIVGMLSDRTRSRFGRRTPWIVGGIVVGAALTTLMPIVPTIALLVIAWSIVQSAVNTATGPLGATVADRVPGERIGLVSAVTGLISYVGIIIGSVIAGSLFAAMGLAVYYPIALILVLPAISFVFISRDRSSQEMTVPRLRFRTAAAAYIAGLRDHDYRWAWMSKVLFFLCYGMATIYSIYMLQSYVRPGLSAEQAAQVAPIIQFAALPGTLIAMYVGGVLSDRLKRRKPFVVVACILMAASFLVPLLWPALPALFIQAIIGGLGLGTFIVVDQALFIDVLPDRAAAGRDLGLATAAGNLGQAIGPVVAGAVVAILGGQYIGIWALAVVVVLAAGAAVFPIKSVR